MTTRTTARATQQQAWSVRLAAGPFGAVASASPAVPSTRPGDDWRKLAFEGKLNDTQKLFWTRTKPKEELYDLEKDPYEVNNIANAESALIQKTRKEMSDALDKWIKDTKDLGEVPEKELIKRGVVKDVLTTEYDDRVKLHPKTPPVP